MLYQRLNIVWLALENQLSCVFHWRCMITNDVDSVNTIQQRHTHSTLNIYTNETWMFKKHNWRRWIFPRVQFPVVPVGGGALGRQRGCGCALRLADCRQHSVPPKFHCDEQTTDQVIRWVCHRICFFFFLVQPVQTVQMFQVSEALLSSQRHMRETASSLAESPCFSFC